MMIPDWRDWVERIDKTRFNTAVLVIAVSGVAGYLMGNPSVLMSSTQVAQLPAPVKVVEPAGMQPLILTFVPRPPAQEAAIMASATAMADALTSEDEALAVAVSRGDTTPSLTILTEPDTVMEPSVSTQAQADCAVSVSADPAEPALVALSIDAPCHSGEEISLVSGGISFSEYLDSDGHFDMMFPAMMPKPVVTVSFDDGSNTTAMTELPDFGAYNRIALTWNGGTGLQLHALENGAGYDQPGHVWAENPQDPDLALSGEGGFMMALGHVPNGRAADIYTYPAAMDIDATVPELSVEVEVTENTCESRVSGNIFGAGAGLPVHMPLTLSMPGCDAVGQYLVLKNPGQEMKLAAE
ncbi:MAG: hypothetical protein P8X76_01620 [Maritimibacter sp.]